ncbi:nucleoid-associated protein [Bacillus pumilus]|uniref:nucleoid-associated protein n=1 Tax=Bacillus pumilus TaxID=1408 RepID=UPI00209D8AFD|nr:nucleoid-associated protein [Bacillus pumilus]MCP1527426.1 hypothetical protein [Bacillus pumilus]MDF9786591.1 hypothetical protein [Bacillus pumilus]
MTNIRRIFDSIHHMDIKQKKITGKANNHPSIDRFLQDLMYDILSKEDKRYYIFNSETVEINTLISGVFEQDITQDSLDTDFLKDVCNTIADRALEKHINAQEKHSMINIQEGSLIQSLIEYESELYFLITKVEHENFLDSDNFREIVGVPYNKKTRSLKSCLIKFDDGITDIIVTDTNTTIAAYWYREFLELKELNTDGKNTLKAFMAFDKILKKDVLKQSEADYTQLYNSLLGYFRNHQNFAVTGVIKEVLEEYIPENPAKIKTDKLIEKFQNEMKKGKFDTKFTIEKTAIKKRMRTTYKVSEKVEIRINGHIEDLRDKIYAKTDEAQNRVIIVKVDDEEKYNETFRLLKFN